MITENEIKNIINEAKEQINLMDTSGFSHGRLNRYLSKAFVAGLGRHFLKKYNSTDYESRFQDFKNGLGINGEWLFDIVVTKMRKTRKNNQEIKYPCKIEIAIESEFAPGIKAFVDDFSKLLIVEAPYKIFINGVKNSKNKKAYIEKRMDLIKYILAEQTNEPRYIICFVDHPFLWNNSEAFVEIIRL